MSQDYPRLISDGDGGAIITREGVGIFAQRIDVSGALLWGADGVQVRSMTAYGRQIAGAVITWLQRKTTYDDDVSARVVNAAGVSECSAGGTALCTDSVSQLDLCLTTDGTNGGIVGWPAESYVDLAVYSVVGHQVATLVGEVRGAGPRAERDRSQVFQQPANPRNCSTVESLKG